MSNTVEPGALLLVLIIFAWTPPHFWALALDRKEEYRNANVPMLPVTHGESYTRWHILIYTLILFVVTLMPFLDRDERCDLPRVGGGARHRLPLLGGRIAARDAIHARRSKRSATRSCI